MADESNGESTFEFVEKKADGFSISGETVKTDSLSSLSSSASLVPSVEASTSAGNLLSNVAPPAALPSFVANPVPASSRSSALRRGTSDSTGNENNDPVKKQPQPTAATRTERPRREAYYSASFSPAVPSTQSTEVPLSLENSAYDLSTVGGGLFSWVKETVANNSVLSKVAEKAKSSVNSMIVTLDPQMREFVYSGGDVEILVASDKDIKVSPVQEAFQNAFGRATVTGVPVDATAIAAQPVGFAAGVKAAEEKINSARANPALPKDIPIVAVENFLLEVGEDRWYDLEVVLLDDPKHGVNLQTFTQMTPVPSQIVALAQQATPRDYPLKWSGLAVTVGNLMANNLQVSHNEWHCALTGVSRRDVILLAAESLAGIYKNTINPV